MSAINRFLGDTPLRVALKLIVVSLLVGAFMSVMGWTPRDLLYHVLDLIDGIWYLGFDAIYRFWGYLLIGAVVVVPAFLILRLVSYRR